MRSKVRFSLAFPRTHQFRQIFSRSEHFRSLFYWYKLFLKNHLKLAIWLMWGEARKKRRVREFIRFLYLKHKLSQNEQFYAAQLYKNEGSCSNETVGFHLVNASPVIFEMIGTRTLCTAYQWYCTSPVLKTVTRYFNVNHLVVSI